MCFRKGAGKRHCVGDVLTDCLWYIHTVSPIMFRFWDNVPELLYIWCPWFTLLCFFMDDYFSTKRHQGIYVEINPLPCHSYANNLGFMINVRSILNVMSECCTRQNHRWIGKSGWMEHTPTMKWFLHMCTTRLATLTWKICGGISWNLSSTSVINIFKDLGYSLSKWCSYGFKPHFTSFFWIVV